MTASTHRRAERESEQPDLEPIFAAERDERLSSMEQALLSLERAAGQREGGAALQTLLRDAHSLKGAAQLLGKREIADLTHALESRLQQMNAGSTSERDLDLLLRAVDALRLLSHGRPVPGIGQTLAELAGDTPAAKSETVQLPLPGGPEAGGDPVPAEAARPVSPPAHQPATPAPATAPEQVVRVPTSRLDALLARSAEFSEIREASERQRASIHSMADAMAALRREVGAIRTSARAIPAAAIHSSEQLSHLLRELDRLERQSAGLWRETRLAARVATAHAQRVARVATDLEAELLDLRMVPVETLLRGFRRMVRDLAREYGREVTLEAVGWDTPIDHGVAARLKDPVMHLLRNAVVHGIEPPDVREKAGKPRLGHIAVVAAHRGGDVVLEIRDDGAGIDVEAVHRRALAQGRIGRDVPFSRKLALELVLEPEFSTAERVDSTSGRGVGLDVVRAQLTELGGSLEIATEPGQGTTFVLRLPLTLVSQHVVVAWIGGRRYGLPFGSVERIVPIAADLTTDVGTGTVLRDADETLLLVDGGRLLDVPDEQPGKRGSRRLAIIMGAAAGRVALAVDRLDGERELVVKDLGSLVRGLPLYGGAAAIEEESLLLVLDPSELVARALSLPGAGQGERAQQASDAVPRILVVDDSITTRTLEKNILAAAGFEVLTAVDGSDALTVLRHERVDLVLSDIEMPRLDGLKLSKRIKNDPRLSDVPIVLISGVEREGLHEEAQAAGADAFLAKSSLDQRELLRVIGELIG